MSQWLYHSPLYGGVGLWQQQPLPGPRDGKVNEWNFSVSGVWTRSAYHFTIQSWSQGESLSSSLFLQSDPCLWPLPLTSISDLYLWSLSLTIVSNHCLWPLSLTSVSDPCLWPLSLTSVSDLCLWPMSLTPVFDPCLWPLSLTPVFDPCLWPLSDLCLWPLSVTHVSDPHCKLITPFPARSSPPFRTRTIDWSNS